MSGRLSSLSKSKGRRPLQWPNELKGGGAKGAPMDPALLGGLKLISGVCLDIDDTLSTHGKLTPEAYASLWNLKASGFAVVPVTGRPAGWCDHIVRFWPVDAVIGENGAFTMFMEKGGRKSLLTPSNSMELKKGDGRLQLLARKIQRAFPGARFASDQKYREHDLAIDFCEDVAPWPKAKIQRLVEFCRDQGAQVKVSSIHVNTWYGHYDKFDGFKNWVARGFPGLTGVEQKKALTPLDRWIYVGDSPNDEPLFASFPYSVGVANLKPFLKGLTSPPVWMTSEQCGAGFTQVADFLIKLKARSR